MAVLYLPFAIDKENRQLNVGKQIAIGLLNLDLERKERISKAILIGWPILIKSIDQKKFLVLDSTLTLVSKLNRNLYPDYKAILEDVAQSSNIDDFISKLKKIRLDARGTNEVSLSGLINLDVSKLITIARRDKYYEMFTLEEKITDHDIKLIGNNLISLKTEANSTITSLEFLVNELNNLKIKFKKQLDDKINEITKKYEELIRQKINEVETEIAKASPEIINEIQNEFDQNIKNKLLTSITNYVISNLKYEGGVLGSQDLDKSRRDLDEVINEIVRVKDRVGQNYVNKIRRYKGEINDLEKEKNSELFTLNEKINDLENVINNIRVNAERVKQEITSFNKYVNSFYYEIDSNEDIKLIIPFLLAVTSTNRRIVVVPQVYNGKQNILGKIFKRQDLSTPLMSYLDAFTNYVKNVEAEDNIKINSRDIDNGLKEISDDGWKSKESVADIYVP
ncbi:hypothetical protein BFU36_06440 [Sulfolobus sp. A20]|uniref:coiled-coil domain-containing protein n=1 Tax=Sulfolobaceae TaxID=118883 RepID=UPI000845F069|nr:MULTISPECIES: hypothetical protein [unclassified Sulfolobus]TRM77150.1 hypothetical protein DJ528_07190 [Sulfolobus sp. B5]TRM84308.1 hypothetical protein DJ531_01180 [Sulfolobus sp. A20-N-F6]TRM89609.1 hypothetical protein DJ529_01220 [Sulfolobus sp. C3]TRM95255.1 hypothetical protein DJ526_00975 [Sulfolobus sp. A20-N-G8]TRM98588.1 hypothetical protein DJ527_10240 [Sulfolobus sp. F1]